METQSRQVAAIDEIEKFCEYEIAASLWARHLSRSWAQRLAGIYFAWKTQRKHERYQRVKHMGAELRAQGIIADR